MMKPSFRSWWKLIGFVFILIFYFLLLVMVTLFSGKNQKPGMKVRGSFCRAAMKWMGMKLQRKGVPYEGACLYISNHRSMLDPLIELGVLDTFILSKAEVSKYPLIGSGAKKSGVLFVERHSPDSRKSALLEIEKCLLSGNQVMIYPEGTTQDGPLTSDFRKGSFEVAAKHTVPVVPVMIEYPDASYYWTDGSLLDYYHRIFSGTRKHVVKLEIGKPILSTDAEFLVRTAKGEIDAMILSYRK